MVGERLAGWDKTSCGSAMWVGREGGAGKVSPAPGVTLRRVGQIGGLKDHSGYWRRRALWIRSAMGAATSKKYGFDAGFQVNRDLGESTVLAPCLPLCESDQAAYVTAMVFPDALRD